MLGVAVGWQLYELTGSALDLGLVGLAQFAADDPAHPRRRTGRGSLRPPRSIVVVCEVVKAAAAAALALGAIGGWQSRTSIFAPGGAARRGAGLREPRHERAGARGGGPPAHRPRDGVGDLGGADRPDRRARARRPPLRFGPAPPTSPPAALFILAGALAAAIRVERVARPREPITLETVFSGVAFIYSRRVLLGTMSLDLFAVLLGGATALLPVFAKDILGWARSGSGCCARRPRWARWPRPCSWRATRWSGASGRPSSAR